MKDYDYFHNSEGAAPSTPEGWILRALRTLWVMVHGSRNDADTESGICDNVWLVLGHGTQCPASLEARKYSQRYLGEAFRTWPEFSGDLHFPVKEEGPWSPGESYIGTYDKWSGEYGAARIRLLAHCIEFYKSAE